MILGLTANNKILVVKFENEREHKKLREFPGLIHDRLAYYAPAKPNIVFNLYNRLKNNFKLKVTQEILDIVNQPLKLKPIPESFKFYTKPLRHQEVALRFMYTLENVGLLLDPGLGKTKTVLDYIALMEFKKSLIVCPKALLFVWEDEVRVHRPDKSIYVVKTTDWEQEKEGIEKADIVVINYNKAVTFETQLIKVGFQFLAVDEGLIKDPSTDRTKAITNIGKWVDSRCIMSGTLINNSPLDAFAPVRFLEPSLVGNSYSKFVNTYGFTKKINNMPVVVGVRNVSEIRSILNATSIVMTKDEWLDLPAKKFIEVRVQMGDAQRKAYFDLMSNYIVEIDGRFIEVDNPLTIAAKLVQISNGFVYYKNDDSLDDLTGKEGKKRIKRETIFFPEQPKIQALLELVKEKLPERRMIVWYNMAAERELIQKALDENGITYLTIAGGEKDTGGKVREFNTNPSIRILLCQAKSVNYGITVLGKSREALEEMDIEIPPKIDTEIYTHIFYSLNFSLEVFLQQQDRSHRIGQTHECEYYKIICNSPIENHINDKIANKISIRNQMLIDYIENLEDQIND